MSNSFFSIKTKDSVSVNKVLAKQKNVAFSGLNILADSLKIGQIIFIVFGGDKPEWDTGLAAVGTLSKTPYNYEGRNFKVNVDIKILLQKPLKRADFLLYPQVYDIIGIGPITKWEPNQALSQIPEEKAFALFNAIFDLDKNAKNQSNDILNQDQIIQIKKYNDRFILRNTSKKLPSPNISSFTPTQVIYYGVPGCGKSKKVQDAIANVEEYNKVRVVFHPEYSSADFIGQIFPCVCEDGHGVDYRFKAGPFSEILRRAYLNPQQQFYLVIEEINRGNAAAIFSDVFQLLDRLKKENSDSVGGNTYTAGWSQYFVDNADINGYIRKESAFLNEISDENRELIHRGVAPSSDKDSAKCYKSIKITDCNGCEINFTANTAIRLPPNLSIFATMNTSDQNVFTLDNAFKRRFDSELIKNTLAGDEHKVQRETKIEGTSVTWGEFWEKINNLILEKNASMTSTEDKRLGAYFIVGDEKTDAAGNKYREVSKKLFGEKVLEYLWNDAFKFKHKDIFKEDCKSVESLIDNFEKGGFAAVFKNDEFTAATVQELKASDN